MTVVNTNIAETINIGQNGTYDVARYTTANVNVDMTPKLAVQYRKDANGKVLQPNTIIDLDGATDVSDYAFAYIYNAKTELPSIVELNSLTIVSGREAFSNAFNKCSNITSVKFGSLETISGREAFKRCFAECTNLTNINLSSLKTISGYQACTFMFYGCTGITSVVFSSLENVSGDNACQNMFNSCSGLVSISFPALKTVSSSYVFGNLVKNTTGVTIHFPSNLSSYNFSCDGTNTTVLYDLPATA